MYVQTNPGLGVRAYRRRKGFGFALASEQPSIVRSAGQTYVEQMDTSGDYVGPTGTSGTSTFTQWLNANSTMVTVGAVAFVGLLLFAKAGR